jgi:hypothetical protein
LAVLRMRCALKLRQSLHRQRLEFALCWIAADDDIQKKKVKW